MPKNWKETKEKKKIAKRFLRSAEAETSQNQDLRFDLSSFNHVILMRLRQMEQDVALAWASLTVTVWAAFQPEYLVQ